MKKVLITGAGGFVGKYLSKIYADKNEYEVYGTVRNEADCVTDGCIKIVLDLKKQELVDEIIKTIKPDIVVHLAAQSSVKLAWEDPIETMYTNVIGTMFLLDSLKKYDNDAKIVLVGSSEEYGSAVKKDPYINEESSCVPENIYAISKYTQGRIGRLYAKTYGMDIVMTRSFNHTGPMQSPTFVVSDFCRQVAMIEKGLQENVIRVGNLSAYRDFTDVRDIAYAYYLLSINGKRGEVYNVASGMTLQIEQILNKIVSMSDTQIIVEIDPNKFRPTEVPKICPDITKIKEDTGWEPKIDIDDTIEDVLNYWRNELPKSKVRRKK